MRSGRSTEHQEAVSRRLAQLSAELAAAGDGPTEDAGAVGVPENPWAAPATHTRVRPDRLAAAEWRAPAPPTRVRSRPGAGPGADPTPAPSLPVPGRHRRADRPRLVPPLGPVRAQVSLGPGQVAVVGVLAVLAVLVSGWWLLRAHPSEVVAPVADEIDAPSPLLTALTPAPALTADPAATAEVVVDVAGKVRRPGIAVLATGSRVVDALEAAGGARPGVDLTALNLARPLVDGEQILVGIRPAGGVAAGALSGPGASGPPTSGALVALNSADQTMLETLPDVGPVTAQAILSWRDEHGAFASVDELLEVDGIGEATLARLAPLVTL